MIEIKLSQGAKPGKGGILPNKKVTSEIAKIRGIPIGEACISPNSHTAFSNVDQMIDFIEKLADISGLPIGIKSAIGKIDFWIELAEKMKDLAVPQQDMVVKIGHADPTRPIDEIITKSKKRKGKNVSFLALEEDYTRLSSYSNNEGCESVGEAAYELTKDALDRSGY